MTEAQIATAVQESVATAMRKAPTPAGTKRAIGFGGGALGVLVIAMWTRADDAAERLARVEAAQARVEQAQTAVPALSRSVGDLEKRQASTDAAVTAANAETQRRLDRIERGLEELLRESRGRPK